MTLGWVIFWLLYFIIAVAFAVGAYRMGSIGRVIDQQIDDRPNVSVKVIVSTVFVTAALVIIMWPLSILLTIPIAINKYIRRKEVEVLRRIQ